PFVDRLLVDDARKLAGPLLNRLLDIVGRHIVFFGLQNGGSKAGIAVRLPSPHSGRRGDFPDDLGENLPPLRVERPFFVLGGCPLSTKKGDRKSTRLNSSH